MRKECVKVVKFLLENGINEDKLVLNLEEEVIYYNGFEWELNEYCEVTVEKYKLTVEDQDGYILEIYSNSEIKVVEPEDNWTELERLREENEYLHCKIEELKEEIQDCKEHDIREVTKRLQEQLQEYEFRNSLGNFILEI